MAGLSRWPAAVAIVLVAAGLTGCSSTGVGQIPPPASSRVWSPGSRPTKPAARASRPAARVSRAGPLATPPSHLIVVIEENHSLEQIIGSPAAPFLNHLAAHGTLLTDYHAITHPSLPNYVALLSGRTGRIRSDCVHCTIAGPTLLDQLEARHLSWAAYLQGLPRPCSTVARSGAYTEAVDPFMHAARVRDDPARCGRVLPFRRFGADLAAGRLPTVAFVVPDLDHDMHSGPVRVADRWLRRLVAELESDPVWHQDTRLMITFDESTGHDVRSCCGGVGRGGLVPAIVAGPRIPEGRDPTPYTHYSLLRSVEAAFGLPFLGHAADPTTATIPAVADPSPDRE